MRGLTRRTTVDAGCDDGAVRAIRYERYGTPDVLGVREVDVPVPVEDEVLVRVRAAAVNPLDCHLVGGVPEVVRTQSGFSAPRNAGLGVDLAGEVTAIGPAVIAFRPGDAVFGSCDLGSGVRSRAFAEYAIVRQDGSLLLKPERLTFAQAAAAPIAGLSALQALRHKGNLQPGQRVLINGAGGGIGTFAVQIAKAYGGEVTAVCSGGNVAMVRELGADHVIDYTSADFLATDLRYDLLIDLAGSRTVAEYRRVLTPRGVLVAVGGPIRGTWVGPLLGPLRLIVSSMFTSQTLAPFLTRNRRADLIALAGLMESGQVTPVIGRTYTLDEVPEAIGYVGAGHASGKVIIDVGA